MVVEKMKASMEKRLENAPLEAVARGLGFNSPSYRSCVVSRNRVSLMLTMYNRMLIQIFDEGGFGEFSLAFRVEASRRGAGRPMRSGHTIRPPRLGSAVRAAQLAALLRPRNSAEPFGQRCAGHAVRPRRSSREVGIVHRFMPVRSSSSIGGFLERSVGADFLT